MNHFTKAFLISSILLSSQQMFADTVTEPVAAENKTVVRGRVLDADNQALPGAYIRFEDGSCTVSDINGYYIMPNVQPGIHSVKVSYVGFSPMTFTINVSQNKTLVKNITLKDNTTLKELTVLGAFSDQQRALNMQKNNLNITNIVSADQVGKFPDSNIGDALKRINGLSVQYDQGEARFGQIRGTSPDLSSVTVNGNRLPSAESDARNVQLDLIPADMIQTIEVSKVVTPDMDGDAIGGSVNLVTKNTPSKRITNFTFGTGGSFISGKPNWNLGATYGDRFLNNKLGLLLSASYQYNPIGSDNTEFEYDEDEGKVFLTDAEIRQYYVTRQRQSYSLALDYDFNANHKVYFKSIYNRRHDWENRYKRSFEDLADGEGEMKTVMETKGGTPDNKNARLELQQTMDFTLGGNHQFGRLKSDWSVAYSRASESRPNERYIGMELKDQTFTVNQDDIRKPYITTLPSIMEAELDEITESNQEIYENDIKAKLDFDLPILNGTFQNKFKFGGKFTKKDKKNDVDFYEYSPVDEDKFMADVQKNFVDQTRDGFMAGDQYKAGEFVSNTYLGSLDLNNSSLFEKKEVKEEEAENYNATEQVGAAYIRFDQQLGKNLQIMAGLRMEHTKVEYQGYEYTYWEEGDDEFESLKQTAPAGKSYINWLPSFLLKYEPAQDLKIRASYTKTLARPKYISLVPNLIIDRSKNKMEMGNPNLNPATSHNFDLSFDYYFKSIGLASVGVFYKKINDFIVDQVVEDYSFNGNVYDEMKQSKNAGNADLLGVEVALQRDFGFISPKLKCLGFYGTYTYTHTKVNNFNFEGRENEKDLPMPGSPEHTANASLYYDNKGLNVRLSYNFTSEFIDEMGSCAALDRYYDRVSYLDLNASYTLNKKFKTTFFAEATNLLNQPLRYYCGDKDRTMQVEYYGPRINAGVKFNF